jgi:hypothetical protein
MQNTIRTKLSVEYTDEQVIIKCGILTLEVRAPGRYYDQERGLEVFASYRDKDGTDCHTSTTTFPTEP